MKEFIFGNVVGYRPAALITKELFRKLTKNLVTIVVVYALGAQLKKIIWERSHRLAFWWTPPPPLSANVITECPIEKCFWQLYWRAHPQIHIFRVKWNATTKFISWEVRTHNKMCFIWIKIPQWVVSRVTQNLIQDAFHIKWKYTTRYVSCDVKSHNKISHVKRKYLMVVFRVKWDPTMRCVLHEKNIHMMQKLLYSVSEIFPIAQAITIVRL